LSGTAQDTNAFDMRSQTARYSEAIKIRIRIKTRTTITSPLIAQVQVDKLLAKDARA